jgi:hypothetical protein
VSRNLRCMRGRPCVSDVTMRLSAGAAGASLFLLHGAGPGQVRRIGRSDRPHAPRLKTHGRMEADPLPPAGPPPPPPPPPPARWVHALAPPGRIGHRGQALGPKNPGPAPRRACPTTTHLAHAHSSRQRDPLSTHSCLGAKCGTIPNRPHGAESPVQRTPLGRGGAGLRAHAGYVRGGGWGCACACRLSAPSAAPS